MTFKIFLRVFFCSCSGNYLMHFWSCSLFTIFSRMQGNKIIFTIFHRQYYIITKTLVTAFKDQPCFLGTFLYKLTFIYVFENPKQNVVFWVFETLKSISQFKANKSSPCALTVFFLLSWSQCLGLDKAKSKTYFFFAFYSNFLQFFFAIDYKN